MNRYLTASMLVGSVLGYYHGRMYRPVQQTIGNEILYGARDSVVGAVTYPFMIPIATYQLAVNTTQSNSCVFKSIFGQSK